MGRQPIASFNPMDGHIWYVVDADGKQRIVMGIIFLDHYEDLKTWVGKPGLFFVRDAAADEAGEHGDPTVHKGWAMYTWDGQMIVEKSSISGGWRKVAEQESVDGPWGIDEYILKMLVKKVDYNADMKIVNDAIKKLIRTTAIHDQSIQSLAISVTELNRTKHEHKNLTTLDQVSSVGETLLFQNAPVSCYFLYNNIKDGQLLWKNPDDPEDEEFADTSLEIAEKFAETSLAHAGRGIEILEVDGSWSRFTFVQDRNSFGTKHLLTSEVQLINDRAFYNRPAGTSGEADEEITMEQARELIGSKSSQVYFADHTLICRFEKTVHPFSAGNINYVFTLPEDNDSFDGRGIWCPLYDDGFHTPKHFFVSIDGVWTDMEQISGSQVILHGEAGCQAGGYCDDNPGMPFKKNVLHWTDPDRKVIQDTIEFCWHETVIVRKFGSPATRIDEGTVVFRTTDRMDGQRGFTDTCPYSDEPVYYTFFAVTGTGAIFEPTVVEPLPLTWRTIIELTRMSQHRNLFKVGDTIILPDHPVYGKIVCDVIFVDEFGIRVCSKDVLEKLAFGDTSEYTGSNLEKWIWDNFVDFTKYRLSQDAMPMVGKDYWTFSKTSGFTKYTPDVHVPFPFDLRVYELDPDHPNGIVTGCRAPNSEEAVQIKDLSIGKHYHHETATTDWWLSDSLGDKVLTCEHPEGVAPTEELGGVVVFMIGHNE